MSPIAAECWRKTKLDDEVEAGNDGGTLCRKLGNPECMFSARPRVSAATAAIAGDRKVGRSDRK